MQELSSGEAVRHPQPAWDTTVCPECDSLAEVHWRAVLESTAGPVEHAKVMCAERHWFLLPVASLARRAGLQAQGASNEILRIGSPDGDPPGA